MHISGRLPSLSVDIGRFSVDSGCFFCFFLNFRFFVVFSSGFPAEGGRGGEFVRFFLVFGPGPVLLCFFFVFSSCFLGFLLFFGFLQVVFLLFFKSAT